MPPFSDRVIFTLAPTAAVAGMLMGFAVVPFGPGLFIIDLNIGLLFFLAMTSLAVYSVLLGGLASNSKYSLLGGLRSAAQMVTYEVFMALSLMGVVMMTGLVQSLRDRATLKQDLWFCIPQVARSRHLHDRRRRRDAPVCRSICPRPSTNSPRVSTPNTRA